MDETELLIPVVVVLFVVYLAGKLLVPGPGPQSRHTNHRHAVTTGPLYFGKYYLARIWLTLARRKMPHASNNRARDYRAMLEDSREVAELECSTDVDPHLHGHNSLYVNGSDKTGATRLIARVAIRSDGRRDVCFFLRLPSLGDLVLPQHPHCEVVGAHGLRGFGGGGLNCTVTDPLKIWRINFNGVCRIGRRNQEEEDKRRQVHLRCTFIWSTFTTYFNFSTDVISRLLADRLAKESWTPDFWTKFGEMVQERRWEQFGLVHGVVQVDDQEEQEVVMRGVKDRSLGSSLMSDNYRCISIYIVLEDGNCLYVGASYKPGSSSYSTTGYEMGAIGGVIPVVSTDLPLAYLAVTAEHPPIRFSFSAQPETGERLAIDVHIEDVVSFNIGHDSSVRLREGLSRFTVSGVHGRGVCQLMSSDEGCAILPLRFTPRPCMERTTGDVQDSEGSWFVVSLRAPSCRSTELTGGKGSQLAKLTSLLEDSQLEHWFELPRGFVVTTSAFRNHVKTNPVLEEAVRKLTAVSCALCPGSLEDACERTVALFTETDISCHLKREISHLFRRQFGDPTDGKTFAVRSSAVGEDSKQMSAAGQLETFLGIKTVEKVFEQTRKCWASQYSSRAVRYRRQYGQVIGCHMAVVVQEMVPAQCAGVIFSRDPLSGNPTRVIINANYGLGESVVAGLSEADTITLKVDESRNLSIIDKKIGSKERAVFSSGNEGTETKLLADDTRSRCSLAEDLSLRLGYIALELDEYFGDGRDIEWGVVDDTIYLLQARPITAHDTPTRYELMHEFDAGQPSDSFLLTTANAQEIHPGCCSPLSISASSDVLDFGAQVAAYSDFGIPTSFPCCKVCSFFCNQMLISVVALSSCFLKIGPLQQDSFSPSIGVMIDDSFIDVMNQLNAPLPSTFQRLLNLASTLRSFWNCKAQIESASRDVQGYFIKTFSTAREQYDDVVNGRYHADYVRISRHYSAVCWKASFGQLALNVNLARYSKHVESDFAKLLASGPESESVKAPLALEQIARTIKEEGNGERFLNMTQEQAVQWLMTPSSGGAGRCFLDFLQIHGHRSFNEVGLESKSWAMDPEQLVPSLQTYVKGPMTDEAKRRVPVPVSDLVDQLDLQLPSAVRWMLVNWFVPMARYVVAEREICKSIYVRSIHQIKAAYWRLAKLMVGEGLIPDEELLFYFSLHEIGLLLKESSPSLIARAHRRRRVEPEMASKQFPKLIRGRPTPIAEEGDIHDLRDVTKLKGTPICHGVVRGQAVVVVDFKNASHIKNGDILITRTTDIGWSPYFPIIGGLVTEIGGLVSHGAIVAREYGVPCVVNIPKATSLIKTGEIVVVDGSEGTVSKHDPPFAAAEGR